MINRMWIFLFDFPCMLLLLTAVQTEKFIAITAKQLLFSTAMWLQLLIPFSIQWKSTFERGEYIEHTRRMFVR